MDEFNQVPSSSISSEWFLEELENLILVESRKISRLWVDVDRLDWLFYEKFEVSLEEVARSQGYRNDLRSFFRSYERFAIYRTQVYQKFYVALSCTLPGSQNVQSNLDHNHASQSSKASKRWTKSLKRTGNIRVSCPSQEDLKLKSILPAEVKSIDDLELALIEIINILIMKAPKKVVLLSALSQKFCNVYKQPIRVVMRSLCPNMKLIELLEVIPGLRVKKVDRDWEIAVVDHLSN